MFGVSSVLIERNALTLDDVAMVIPHQANIRIINAAADRLGIPREKVLINIDRYGNTTSGTIPLATRDAIMKAHKLTQGLKLAGLAALVLVIGANQSFAAAISTADGGVLMISNEPGSLLEFSLICLD
jgi:3-oxoacyl-[acyl-carrier-protein] synthase-3